MRERERVMKREREWYSIKSGVRRGVWFGNRNVRNGNMGAKGRKRGVELER